MGEVQLWTESECKLNRTSLQFDKIESSWLRTILNQVSRFFGTMHLVRWHQSKPSQFQSNYLYNCYNMKNQTKPNYYSIIWTMKHKHRTWHRHWHKTRLWSEMSVLQRNLCNVKLMNPTTIIYEPSLNKSYGPQSFIK
jgi:hypothetical protein